VPVCTEERPIREARATGAAPPQASICLDMGTPPPGAAVGRGRCDTCVDVRAAYYTNQRTTPTARTVSSSTTFKPSPTPSPWLPPPDDHRHRGLTPTPSGGGAPPPHPR
jgi:hypothetical protein